MKTIKTTIIVLVTIIFFISCSSDDTVTVQTPSVTYNETTIDAVFFQEGSSTAPNINWNGNQGSFSLTNTIQGLTINTTTGILNWTKALPQGTHSIQVASTNSAGQISINLTIDNRLEGVFSYNFENNCKFELDFIKDGNLNVRNIGGTDIIANGSWVINGSEVIGNYTFLNGNNNNNSQESIKSSLTHTLTEVKLEGNWYNGSGTISGQEGGNINLNLGQMPAGDGIIVQIPAPDNRYRILFYDSCGGACCFNTVADAQNAYPNKTLIFIP